MSGCINSWFTISVFQAAAKPLSGPLRVEADALWSAAAQRRFKKRFRETADLNKAVTRRRTPNQLKACEDRGIKCDTPALQKLKRDDKPVY